MNFAMLMSMIPGAEDFKRQGLELLNAAKALTDAVDNLNTAHNEQAEPHILAAYEAHVFTRNAEFKQCLAKLPPLPEGL